jgi:energy-coupling factor transporter ATP-binding protein EcfA2
MALFTPAVKERLKARVAIDGPTGSGKTWTALQWARILAGPDGKIGVIDTENRSAAYYAPNPGEQAERVNWWDPPYEFGHFAVQPPYDPRQLRSIIQAAGDELGENGVLVIDSLTHYWNGEGGTLDVVDNASQRSGNSFTGWKEGTPAQRGMLDAIIHANCHVIVTMRSKMEYVLEETTNSNGRKITVPKKLGMAPEQRSGVEYEFTVVADMDLEHRLIVSKSRCSAIADAVVTAGRSQEPAQAFAEWLGSGVERVASVDAEEIVALIDETVADDAARKELKRMVVAEFGRPPEWTTDRLDDIRTWVAEKLLPFKGEAVVEVEAVDAEVEVEVEAEQADDAVSGNGTSDGAEDDDPGPDPGLFEEAS